MSLEEYREHIDNLDAHIIELLAQRLNIVRKISILKKTHHLPVEDLEREKSHFQQLKLLAKKNNMDTFFVEKLFHHIIEECKKEMR